MQKITLVDNIVIFALLMSTSLFVLEKSTNHNSELHTSQAAQWTFATLKLHPEKRNRYFLVEDGNNLTYVLVCSTHIILS